MNYRVIRVYRDGGGLSTVRTHQRGQFPMAHLCVDWDCGKAVIKSTMLGCAGDEEVIA